MYYIIFFLYCILSPIQCFLFIHPSIILISFSINNKINSMLFFLTYYYFFRPIISIDLISGISPSPQQAANRNQLSFCEKWMENNILYCINTIYSDLYTDMYFGIISIILSVNNCMPVL